MDVALEANLQQVMQLSLTGPLSYLSSMVLISAL